ncbi:hypothetical protein [Heyndrickxia acidicola]|uniref:Uncharacterized protein n=1 Tax=Heyndrickxia acidicola TaxID=209389 RepID=A0ABU6MB31_9BACI|nr:hypothetical protein [Heyndrickxia acidicola]MED1201881.1 hypothetical protein [Heyndrickxia acidicola]
MEKTYYIATLIFGWIISVALAVFSAAGFWLGYMWIGVTFLAILCASISMNIVFIRKWFKGKNHIKL